MEQRDRRMDGGKKEKNGPWKRQKEESMRGQREEIESFFPEEKENIQPPYFPNPFPTWIHLQLFQFESK